MSTQVAESVDALESDAPPSQTSVRIGALRLDRATQTVSVAGAPVTLTKLEFALLSYLIAHPGLLLSRARLVDSVWRPNYGGSQRTVDIHVARLRRKLGPALSLKTLRRVGYRFELPPDVQQSDGASA
ncbi:MAG TPA: winged helix-turn-helix domain-containing protein [Polyangiaceae bacterium]|nr:winged helix-turn-helix domain-containing protein [Polyangiaceae bacterium]